MMGIREQISAQKIVPAAIAVVLMAVAVFILLQQFRQPAKANLSQSFYSDDDGQTWFADSAFQVPPFGHNGKTAVSALIYTYDNGSKKFCAYLAKYNDSTKQRLEAAYADAKAQGQPLGSVSLLHDRNFINGGLMVKLPGANNPWIPMDDPHSIDVCMVHSPDGSAIDQLFVY
jgi:hypothetical protein